MTVRTSKKKTKQSTNIGEMLAFDRETVYGAAAQSVKSKTNQLSFFDNQCTGIIGVDEVGRGCLAGPVVASAVMLKDLDPDSVFNRSIWELDDSKKLTHETRERLAQALSAGIYFAVAECSNEEIDQINILQASLLAMRKAVQKLIRSLPFELADPTLLIDGNKQIKTRKHRQITVIKGDSKSASIAAASVVAKVYRDRLMVKLAEDYPQYLWDSNKGYPSQVHRKAIQKHGLTRWHRKTFRWQPKESN